jgi:hydroxymethylglutaryl-CoA reductase (NADPH)
VEPATSSRRLTGQPSVPTPAIPRDSFPARVALVKSLLTHLPDGYEAIRTSLTEDDVRHKIENFVGAVPIPLGLCGPIDIAGVHARGRFIVPMATLEGTLVASYSRGAKVMNLSGGCETYLYGDQFLRAVQFVTSTLERSAALVAWCRQHEPQIRQEILKSSAHASLVELSYDCVGCSVIVSIGLTTGDAMGSNIASKAAGLLYEYVTAHTDLVDDAVVPYPEDKKFIPRRQKGKRVIARCVLKREPLASITRTSLEQLALFIGNLRSLLAAHGAYALNIHAANGMTAMFLAFGQDTAYVAECAQAVLDCRVVAPDSLEVSLTRPTLIVGTVGGGTGLPAFRTTLSMVDCYGNGKAGKLAEIIAAVLLAGEIGSGAAQCAREFVRAHEAMGKNRPQP